MFGPQKRPTAHGVDRICLLQRPDRPRLEFARGDLCTGSGHLCPDFLHVLPNCPGLLEGIRLSKEPFDALPLELGLTLALLSLPFGLLATRLLLELLLALDSPFVLAPHLMAVLELGADEELDGDLSELILEAPSALSR